jgi:hypothetical protein
MAQERKLEQHEEEQEHEIYEQHEEEAPVDSGAAGGSTSVFQHDERRAFVRRISYMVK